VVEASEEEEGSVDELAAGAVEGLIGGAGREVGAPGGGHGAGKVGAGRGSDLDEAPGAAVVGGGGGAGGGD
jgi:hypothetical protein